MTCDTELVGCSIHDVDTPALWVDLDVLEKNIAKMAAFCDQHQVFWRPHVKACKSPDLAQQFLRGGARGVTCAKVSEAEAMLAGGVNDILIANVVVGRQKVSRLVEVARGARLGVACDDEANIREISQAASEAGVTIDVLVDINVGVNRCGVAPSQAAGLARLVSDLPGIRLRGLMGYEGHVMQMEAEEKAAASAVVAEILAEAREVLRAAGYEPEIISGGGSGNYWLAASLGMINELQAGGGALMDITYHDGMNLPGHQFALFVNAQVVSTAVAGRATLDSGWKTTGCQTGLPRIISHEGAELKELHAEHGVVVLEEGVKMNPAERVTMVPHYSDSTVLLHRKMYAVRAGKIEACWPITAAGALQ